MAITTALNKKTVFGDLRVQVYSITVDAATHTFSTGMEHVHVAQMTPQSISTAGKNAACYFNAGAAGTSIAGQIALSGLTSGDVVNVVVYGR